MHNPSDPSPFMDIAQLRARVLSAQGQLSPSAIEIWRTPLSAITPLASELKTYLSADERDRAGKFRFPEHRDAYVAGRALLRMILAGYSGCAPEQLRFAYGQQGKPRIDETAGHLSRTVSFNLSHSSKALQIAVTPRGEIGIDVEDLSRDFDIDGLLTECLTDDEARPLATLSFDRRRSAFLRYWVHKEAFLKCAGTGFSVSPKEVHVAFDSAGRSEMRCSNPLANTILFGRDLETEAGHLAALATVALECAFHSILL